MADTLKLRGGTTTQNAGFTGADREVTVDTTKKTLVVHDGTNAGGTPLMKESGGNAASSVGIGTGGTNAIVIDSSQRIGIGTGSPKRNIHIHENSTGTVGLMLTNDATGNSNDSQGFQLKVGTNKTANIEQREDANMDFLMSGNVAMSIDTSRHVGIGVIDPLSDLHIASSLATIRLEDSDVANGAAYSLITSSSNGNIEFSADPDNVRSGSDFRFHVDGNECMRINEDGNLGIGTSDPAKQLEVKAQDATIRLNQTNAPTTPVDIRNRSGDLVFDIHSVARDVVITALSETVELFRFTGNGKCGIGTSDPQANLSVASDTAFIDVGGTNRGKIGYKSDDIYIATSAGAGKLIFKNNVASTDHPADSGSTLMTINSDGKVLINTTTDTFDGVKGNLNIANTNTNNNTCINLSRNTALGRAQIRFSNPNGNVGSISTDGSATLYNTSSDYRLKENITAISDAITRLKTLKPYRFNFKADTSTTVDGFLAHEVTAVPEAITGTKDEVDADNKPIYQGIDQSKLVPLLVAAVQELIGKVEALEAA